MNQEPPRRKIREWRESQFLTLKELALLVGVKFQTIWNWEHDRARPEFRNIKALARALGIQPSQIIPPEVEPGKGRAAA